MNTLSTAVTRPSSSFGVASVDGRRADVHANHVDEAADRERERPTARTSARARRRPCSRRTRPTTSSSFRPARAASGLRASMNPGDERADRESRFAARRARTGRCGGSSGEERQQCDRAAEEHGEQVERDRAEDDLRVADEADAGEQPLRSAGRGSPTRPGRDLRPPHRATPRNEQREQAECRRRRRSRDSRRRADRRAPARRRRHLRRRSSAARARPEHLGRDDLGTSARPAGSPTAAGRAGHRRPARGTARAGARRGS